MIFDGHERLRGIRTEARQRYWDVFIVDALIGNFDRHSGNWGYFVNIKTGEASLAPVYDCGSCLYPQVDDDSLDFILNSREEIEKRIYRFPRASLKVGGEKISYFELISSHSNKDCDHAFLRIFPRINLRRIIEIIRQAPLVSEKRKEFLSVMVSERYEKILAAAQK